MSTALHSFIDIFDTEFGEGQDAVQLKQNQKLFSGFPLCCGDRKTDNA